MESIVNFFRERFSLLFSSYNALVKSPQERKQNQHEVAMPTPKNQDKTQKSERSQDEKAVVIPVQPVIHPLPTNDLIYRVAMVGGITITANFFIAFTGAALITRALVDGWIAWVQMGGAL